MTATPDKSTDNPADSSTRATGRAPGGKSDGLSGSERGGLLASLRQRAPQGGWLGAMREHAVSVLDAGGLPTRKHEAWRFTSLRGVTDRAFAMPAPRSEERDQALVAWIQQRMGEQMSDSSWLVPVIDGKPRLDAGAMPAGVRARIYRMHDQRTHDQAAPDRDVDEVLGKLARVEHFAALNLALFEHVLVIHADEGAPANLHIVYCGVPAGESTAAYPRVLVVAGAHSRVSLVESFVTADRDRDPGQQTGGAASAHLTCAVTEIAIGAGARVDHVRAHHGAAGAYVLGTVAVRQDRDSGYHSHVVSLGGPLCRLDIDVELGAEGAECRLDGVYHVAGRDHVDHHTCIDHRAPRCTSAESYRGVLDGAGEAVFDGTIVVRRDAQKTRAQQENRNLLLSDDAVINTKPHLRIDADDVSCSHGATIGSLDPDQLFYLRSRGIDDGRARAMLTHAFVREILDRIPDPRVARALSRATIEHMGGGDAIEDSLGDDSLGHDMPDAVAMNEDAP